MRVKDDGFHLSTGKCYRVPPKSASIITTDMGESSEEQMVTVMGNAGKWQVA